MLKPIAVLALLGLVSPAVVFAGALTGVIRGLIRNPRRRSLVGTGTSTATRVFPARAGAVRMTGGPHTTLHTITVARSARRQAEIPFATSR